MRPSSTPPSRPPIRGRRVAEVIVIGAGVVGISSALAIQARGHQVTVLDRAGVAAEASAGNAGALAFADIEPLATPGILRQAPKWLLDPLGPLSVPPGYAPRLAPWLWRFWRASRPAAHRAGTAAQAALMDLSRAAFDRQVADVGGQGFVRPEGQLQLYEGEHQFRASLPGWELRRAHGVGVSPAGQRRGDRRAATRHPPRVSPTQALPRGGSTSPTRSSGSNTWPRDSRIVAGGSSVPRWFPSPPARGSWSRRGELRARGPRGPGCWRLVTRVGGRAGRSRAFGDRARLQHHPADGGPSTCAPS